MKKSLIALAIVAALPVVAQADATISGSVTNEFKDAGNTFDTDASLTIKSSEKLANGMTATAEFGILADTDDDTKNAGKASLSGHFGTLTAGKIDADWAFQAGDLADLVSDTTEGTGATASTASGVHYAAGDVAGIAGLSVATQFNAATNAAGVGNVAGVAGTPTASYTDYVMAVTAPTQSSQVSVVYDLNKDSEDGLVVGFANATASADNASTMNHDGLQEGQYVAAVSYTYGDLEVTAGQVMLKNKSATSPNAVVSATYTYEPIDGLSIKTQVDSAQDYQVDITYKVNDELTLSSEVDKGKYNSVKVEYIYDTITATLARTDDDTTDASIAVDYGNADLTLGRVGAVAASLINGGAKVAYTHLTYKVAF